MADKPQEIPSMEAILEGEHGDTVVEKFEAFTDRMCTLYGNGMSIPKSIIIKEDNDNKNNKES